VYHSLLQDVKFLAFLADVDADLADAARVEGCAWCGGVLDSAAFPRKPRAVGDLPKGYTRRLSFCCRSEGCRRRRTPPSVRFLGRKVYVAAVVVLVTAMQHGATARRISELRALLGISRRTLSRWRRWWQEIFAATASWRVERSRVGAPAIAAEALPLSLIERFDGDERTRAVGALRFIAPVIAASGL
jgi:hypothetical protein